MNSVVKSASYCLVHTPDMVIHNGSTQTTERIVNPESEYLVALPKSLRSFKQAVEYMPNQSYIGNFSLEDLEKEAQPWCDRSLDGAKREGKFGEIMPQEEFLFLMQACDMFDLVHLSESFVAKYREQFVNNPIISEDIAARLKPGVSDDEIKHFVNDEHAEGLYHNFELVGYVKRAHDVDVNLSAHVMHENTVSKASGVLALLHLVKNSGLEKGDFDYVIDCSEEACGDMNQRGGGNFAKAAAEIAGLSNATGSDVRGFCAGPAHAMVMAASLVSSGAFNNVIVSAGGCTAKLGMNGKDHVKKGLPILEDMLGAFAVLVSKNDGVNPEINLSILGRHKVGTGSAPQAVITSLVLAPLENAGLKLTDVDKYAAELQNPDITKPAGAGDVPLANFKMIAALAVKNGDIPKTELNNFIVEHGMPGWAPTQGHIPSGVPYLGYAREAILEGRVKRAMIIGKGSLFLGRMTNLFDGVSFVVQANQGAEKEEGMSKDTVKKLIAEAMRNFAESLQ